MKDYLKDIVQHTHGLGFIESAKIVNEEGTTSLEAMDDDRTVIVQAKFKEQVPGLSGTFGLPNLSKLSILLNIDEYKENANITVNEQDRNGETVPFGLHFENATGDFKNDYRFMSKEIIEQTLQTVKFKGVEWDVTFAPTKAKVSELQAVAGIYGGIEPNFTVKTDNGDLILTVGAADGSFTGKRTFANNVNGEITEGYAWPLNQVLAILRLGMSGTCVMNISKKGALMISVDSGLGKYDYILPALTV